MPKKKPAIPTLSPRKPPQRPAWKRPTSLTLPPGLLAEIDTRGDNRSEVVRADLTRYYHLLADIRARVREVFTPSEIAAIVDVQNGHWYAEVITLGEILPNIEDGCRLEGLDEKWGISVEVLIAKLRGLDLLAVHALADATQRFWEAIGNGDERRNPRMALD